MDKNKIKSEGEIIKELQELGADVTTISSSRFSVSAKITAPGYHREASFHKREDVPPFLESCYQELKNLNLDITIKNKNS